MNRVIKIEFDTWTQLFSDWYDVADFIKQRQLKGLTTTIIQWHYTDHKGEKDHD